MRKVTSPHSFSLIYVIWASVSLSFTVLFKMWHGCVFTDVARLWCLTNCHTYSLLSPQVNPDFKHTDVDGILSLWLSAWKSLSSSILTPSALEVRIKPHYHKHHQVVFSVDTCRDKKKKTYFKCIPQECFMIKGKMMVNWLCCFLLNNHPYVVHMESTPLSERFEAEGVL